MMDAIQMTVTTGIFGVLGAATTYRWLKHTGRATQYSRQRVWLVTFFAALAAAAFWFLFDTGLDRLPQEWGRLVPQAMLIGLAVFAVLKPVKVSRSERNSAHRIQVGIMIGGLILVTICLLVFCMR
jgi:type II secretory pathway pseudopilin PulG